MIVNNIDKQLLQIRISDFLEIVKDMPEEYWTPDNYLTDLKGKWENSLCLCIGNEIIGFIIASVKKDSTIHIHKFIIHKDYRGQGYGKIILQSLIKKIKKSYKYLTLKVAANNSSAIRFYCLNGFAIIKKTENNYLEMQKELI